MVRWRNLPGVLGFGGDIEDWGRMMPTDAELIERLRIWADSDYVPTDVAELMDNAADRLEALTAAAAEHQPNTGLRDTPAGGERHDANPTVTR